LISSRPLRLRRPVLLDQTHVTAEFDCGKPPLNNFLVKHALANQAGGGARTYVSTPEGQKRVIGFYSLAPGSVSPDDAPGRVRKGQPQHPVPIILMARFAVSTAYQGQGLGSGLFLDALLRAVEGADAIGGRAFLVHAKDHKAREFYERFDREPSPTNPFHLYLLFKDIRRLLSS
jgi:GNAT superfamily N-acetyltransferase